jgi:hypothetical protein
LNTIPEWTDSDTWIIQVQQSFWLRPSYLSNTSQWSVTDEKDVWRQSFFLSHKLSDSISVATLFPTTFAANGGSLKVQSPEASVLYSGTIRHSDWMVGTGLSLKSNSTFGWSTTAAIAEVSWNRRGARLDVNTSVRGRLGSQISPHAQLLLDRKRGDRPLQLGVEALYAPETSWVGGVIRHTIPINVLRLQTDLRIPLLNSVDLAGSQFGLQISYFPQTIDRRADRDGDGIVDLEDQCTLEPEDFDGFDDQDGCPDLDNDQDNIPDDQDQCPLFAEDLDDFEDVDGCPDLDNDQDNIVDTIDRCPNEPETVNSYQDRDGCPDQHARNDRDQDGILDQDDICPFEAEIINGIDDTDGCPESSMQIRLLEEDSLNTSNQLYYVE